MALIRFPYLRVQEAWQPVIPIGVRLGSDWQRFNAYVDSGATYSVFQAKLASQLGFDYRQGNRSSLRVGNGSLILIYLHELEVQLGTERFISPVAFSNDLGVSFNVLGKVGIFDKFKICFQQSQKVVTFESST